ncbi:hypothetical protein [Burkholderia multivorans]|uniref:hypothetical protein n=1 Tax=Burkholderia multivorans TaxID=87883 RepID=UPI000755D0A7|nr:hypothetical protein [Burkholderia multivorans]KWH18257.1 hypothetical protein WL98_23620 [Burkholderia multivorans]
MSQSVDVVRYCLRSSPRAAQRGHRDERDRGGRAELHVTHEAGELQQPAGDKADRAGPLLPTGAAHLRLLPGVRLKQTGTGAKEK